MFPERIKLHDKEFEHYLSAELVDQYVSSIAKTISEEETGKDIVFVCILNGSFIFAADLYRKVNLDLESEITFLKASSYENTESTGKVKQLIGLDKDLTGKTVIIIEDIVDTGNTIVDIVPQLQNMGAAEVKVATFFWKPTVYDKDIDIDYWCLSIPDYFVIGYGLDYNGLGRGLKDVFKLKE